MVLLRLGSDGTRALQREKDTKSPKNAPQTNAKRKDSDKESLDHTPGNRHSKKLGPKSVRLFDRLEEGRVSRKHADDVLSFLRRREPASLRYQIVERSFGVAVKCCYCRDLAVSCRKEKQACKSESHRGQA